MCTVQHMEEHEVTQLRLIRLIVEQRFRSRSFHSWLPLSCYSPDVTKQHGFIES